MNAKLEELSKLWKSSLEGGISPEESARLNELMSDADLVEAFSEAQAAASAEPDASLSPAEWSALDQKVAKGFSRFARPLNTRPLTWCLAALGLLGAVAISQFAKDSDKPFYEEVRTELKVAEPKKKAEAPAGARQPAAREAKERELRAMTISLVLTQPAKGQASIRIYDAEGREVREVLDTVVEKGSHSFRWDGKGEDGEKVPAGSYKIEIRGTGGLKTRLVEIRPKK